MTRIQDSRIGRGLLKPLRRRGDDFDHGSGKDLVRSAVRTIVNTRASGFQGKSGGEYPWRRNFGSYVHMLRHSNVNLPGVEGDLAVIYAMDAIEEWDPRVEVRIERSSITEDKRDPRARHVRIYYGVTEQTGADVRLGTYDDSYHEVKL
jgi:phage baseplate assembly protein W